MRADREGFGTVSAIRTAISGQNQIEEELYNTAHRRKQSCGRRGSCKQMIPWRDADDTAGILRVPWTETLKSCENRPRRKKIPVDQKGVSKIASVSWEVAAFRIRGFLMMLARWL